MVRAFKTCSFVISNNLNRSQGPAVHIRQMCISAQSRLHVFTLLVSIWFNIQIRWHTPALKMKAFQRLNSSSCHTIAHVQHNGRSIWGQQTSAEWFPSFYAVLKCNWKTLWNMGFEKGNQTQVYKAFVTCVRKEGCVPGKGYSELCTAASRAHLLKEIPHTQIPLITKASHQPWVGFQI